MPPTIVVTRGQDKKEIFVPEIECLIPGYGLIGRIYGEGCNQSRSEAS
jgi:hypothetical protein